VTPPTIELADPARGDLDAILALQRANLERALEPAEAAAQGYVTLVHTPALLAELHAALPAVVARADGALIGYALAMHRDLAAAIPDLAPMFRLLGERGLADRRWYVMGQICVAKPWRGAGVFDALYAGHRRYYGGRFDLLVTEVAVRNARSMRAHARVGFATLAEHTDATDAWAVVGLPLG
jgi:hypothetical protein